MNNSHLRSLALFLASALVTFALGFVGLSVASPTDAPSYVPVASVTADACIPGPDDFFYPCADLDDSTVQYRDEESATTYWSVESGRIGDYYLR